MGERLELGTELRTQQAVECSPDDGHLLKLSILTQRGIRKDNPTDNVLYNQSVPRGFSLNLCGHCNYKCTYCPTSLKRLPIARISNEILEKVFNEYGTTPLYIQMGSRGEALLHPQFFDIVRYIKNKCADTYICLNSNGYMFSDKIISGLILSGVDQITVSLQTVNEELYEKIEDSKHFTQVVERLAKLAKSLRDHKVKMLLVAQFMDLPENKPYKKQFREYCDVNGIVMQVIQLHEWGDKFETQLIDRANRYPCPYLWLYPTVSHLGNLLPCCIDFFDEMPYGSIEDHSVGELWQGGTAEKMREIHLSGKWNDIPMCRDCTQWCKLPNAFERHGDGSFRIGVHYAGSPTTRHNTELIIT